MLQSSETVKSVHVRLDEPEHRKLKAIAAYKEQTIQAYVEFLVKRHLKRLPDAPGAWS